jgi:hypothetical protein
MSVKSDAAASLAATLPLCLKAYAQAATEGALPAARVVRRCELLAELGRKGAALESALEFLSPLTSSTKGSHDEGSGSDSSDSESSEDEDDNPSPWSGLVHPAEIYAAVALMHTAVGLAEDMGEVVDAQDLRRAFVRLIKCTNRGLCAMRKGDTLNPLWNYTTEEICEPDMSEDDEDDEDDVRIVDKGADLSHIDDAGADGDDDDDDDVLSEGGDTGKSSRKVVTLVSASSHLWSNLAKFDTHNHPDGALATAELWLHLKPWSDALHAPETRESIERSIAKCVFEDAGVEGFRTFSGQLDKLCPSLSLGFYKQAIRIEQEVELEGKIAKRFAGGGSSASPLTPVKRLFLQATGNGGVGSTIPAFCGI